MKLYNGVSFQLLFRVSCHRCSFRNNKKLTSLLMHVNYYQIRANNYITTEDKVVKLKLIHAFIGSNVPPALSKSTRHVGKKVAV